MEKISPSLILYSTKCQSSHGLLLVMLTVKLFKHWSIQALFKSPVPIERPSDGVQTCDSIRTKTSDGPVYRNNSISITGVQNNKKTDVFSFWLKRGRLFACILWATDNISLVIIWVTHYNVYTAPYSMANVSSLRLNSIHLGISLDHYVHTEGHPGRLFM